MKKKDGLAIKHVKDFNIVIMGAGGIFSELEVPLAAILRGLLPVEVMNPNATMEQKFSKVFTKNIRVTIIDGDRFEPGNEYRQNILSGQYGKYKADFFARKLGSKVNTDVYFKNKYIYNSNDLVVYLKHNHYLPILIGCCDNNAARKVMHQACEMLDSVIWIDGGCGEYSGQVVLGIKGDNRILFPFVTHLYPNILDSDIEEQSIIHSNQLGGACSKVKSIDTRNFNQTVVSNMAAAYHIVCLLNDVLMGNELTVNCVDFNTKRQISAPTLVNFSKDSKLA